MHDLENTTQVEAENGPEFEEQNPQIVVKTLYNIINDVHCLCIRRNCSIFWNFQKDNDNPSVGNAEDETDNTDKGEGQQQMGTKTTPTTEQVYENPLKPLEIL